VYSIILNSSVDHDENSKYSEKTRIYRALWIHPSGESIMLDNLLIFIIICHVFRSQLRNLELYLQRQTGATYASPLGAIQSGGKTFPDETVPEALPLAVPSHA
jgi:hypothetical protein